MFGLLRSPVPLFLCRSAFRKRPARIELCVRPHRALHGQPFCKQAILRTFSTINLFVLCQFFFVCLAAWPSSVNAHQPFVYSRLTARLSLHLSSYLSSSRRAEKIQTMKRAKAEAEQEIAKFRLEKEAEFQNRAQTVRRLAMYSGD